LRLLDRAVVYSRASEEGACGLSLYHPYVNKTGYTDKWKDEYQAFSFSPGYQQYVVSFGGMLTGESLFHWMDLFARSAGTDPEGNFVFELPLTPEQRENLVSAQLLILRNSDGSRLEDNCVVLASCPAKIGEDGAVRAEWDGSCLYAEKEDGKLVGPVPFLLTDDGKMKTVIGNYIPEGNYDLDGQMVLYEMDAEDSAEYPEIIRTRVWDEATGSFSSRMRFSEEGYGTLMLYSYHRKYPEAGADQVLPDYQKWEPDSNLLYANTIVLPDAWRLRSSKRESGEQRYAVFRLVDSQQNVVCSLPAAVPNAWRREIPSAGGEIADQNLRAELSCTVNTSPDEYGLQMDWIFENRGTEKISVTLRNLVLNGSRQTDTSVYSILQPGETELETQAFKKYDPLWLDTLESISGTASIRPDSGEEYKVPFEYRFDHDDLSPVNRAEELLAETEQDGIELKLISLEPDTECGWNLTFCLENRTDTTFEEGDYILLNGIYADYWRVDALGPGESRIETRCLNNLATFSWFKALDLPEYAVVYPEMNLMQVLGENLLQEITLISKGENHRTNRRTLTLSEPVPTGERRRSRDAELLLPGIRPPEELPDPREDALPVLRENNIYQVTLRRLLTGNGEIGLTLGLENRSGLWLELEAGECRVNGQPVGTVDFSNRFLPPDSFCVATCVLKEESLSPGTEIRELSLIIYDSTREQDPEACVLTVSPGLCMGDLSWLNGEELTGEPIYAPDVDMEAELNPRLLETEILLPENAKSFRVEVEVEMTPEELAGAKSAKIALMRSAKDGYMQMLTLQDWAPTEEGTFHFPYPGLFPVLAGEEQAAVLTYWKVDDQEVSGTVRASVMLTTNDFDIVNLEDIRWILSQEDQSAKVTSFTQDGAPYGYQSDLAIASVSRIELLPVQGEDGTLPHMADMELHGGFEFNTFLNWPGVQLYGKPMQLSLRPALPEEELYFLISITRKDGSRYSLPLIPYNGYAPDSVL
ncbi:MAG: hypothetical protein K5922_08185, partial [Clostridiales bacterium]|nr:hypothetical protein [Clostridiales bacterium]